MWTEEFWHTSESSPESNQNVNDRYAAGIINMQQEQPTVIKDSRLLPLSAEI